jgi:hypothetical protein
MDEYLLHNIVLHGVHCGGTFYFYFFSCLEE